MPELPNSKDARMAAYRRLLPLAVVAFAGSWAAFWWVGSGIPWDAWLLPAMPVLWVSAWWLTIRRVLSLTQLEIVGLVSLAAFFLTKMAYVAWIAPDPAWHDVLAFSVYLPAFYAMAYWSSSRDRAWTISWLFLSGFLLVASPFLLSNLVSGTPAGTGTALVFVHLTIMSAMIIGFLRAYGETVFHQRVEVDRAERLAYVDELTGMENRRGLERRMQDLPQQMARTGVPFSVVLIDIDHFKRVNDTHGHNAGDDVLRVAGQVLRGSLRSGDQVGRWGGEEFMVVCSAASAHAAAELAERLRRKIADTAFAHHVRLTSSFGVAEARPGESIQSVIGRADAALYEAKRTGRDRVKVDGDAAPPRAMVLLA